MRGLTERNFFPLFYDFHHGRREHEPGYRNDVYADHEFRKIYKRHVKHIKLGAKVYRY